MKNNKSEQGQAIVLLVLLITGLVAIAGLAIDGGRLYSARRNAQNAADNAALAGALAMCSNTNGGTAALASASTNGFNNNGTTNTVDINVPPATGPNAGDSDYIEVIIDSSETGTISRLVFTGQLAYRARAVGHCIEGNTPAGDGYAMIVLHTEGGSGFSNAYDRYTLKSKFGGLLRVNGNTYVDSASPDAYAYYGSGSSCGTPISNYGVKASYASVVGGTYIHSGCSSAYLTATPVTGVEPMGDPLAALVPPSNPAGTCTTYSLTSGSANLSPGEYCSITVSNSAQLTLTPGQYYVSGNILVQDSARLTVNNSLIYQSAGRITFQENAIVTMSSPTSGVYDGLALWMDGHNAGAGDDDCDLAVYDNAKFTVNGGTLYLAEQFMCVYNRSSANLAQVTQNGAQMIVDKLWVGCNYNVFDGCGKAELTLNYDADSIYGTSGTNMIELSE
jgi:hypothetical protein